MPVEIPEPFRSALADNEAESVCDAEAASAHELYARGLARSRVGRDSDARSDFENARPELEDPAVIQLGYLDLRVGLRAKEVAEAAQEIAERSPDGPLKAQALHLGGLAEAKRRNTAAAIDALVAARDECRKCGRRDLLAQVEDTLGMVHGATGRLDLALAHFALSLVEKTLVGDTYGTAITLGNLGRVHLRAGRFDDAINCFELDLDLARQLGDSRGEGRVINDLGRCCLERGDAAQAADYFRQSLAIAEASGRPELRLYNHKDLALAMLGMERLEEAEAELVTAEDLLPPDAAPYLGAILKSVRGQLELARSNDDGLAELEEAITIFQQRHLPDLEIPNRITLAEAQADRGLKRAAESCLRRALEVARSEGYARYLRVIREAMTRLQLVESSVEEEGRLAEGEGVGEAAGPVMADGYVLFETLGKGGFGEVFRAFDPQRSQIVALKRLHLERLYDVYRRQLLMSTARLELEAASRIRHPGVARVHAVGTDAAGGTYVVQEYIDGGSLRELMKAGSTTDMAQVLDTLKLISSALEALHDRGVVHRDLKPENILLRRADQTPVLVDFGIARIPDAEDDLGDRGIVGTLGYMAPEQLRGHALDGRADIYALGVIAFEWLTGRRPRESTGGRLALAIVEALGCESRTLAEFRADLEPGVIDLIDRMLATDPDDRPTAVQVAQTCDLLVKTATGAAWAENSVDTECATEDFAPPDDFETEA